MRYIGNIVIPLFLTLTPALAQIDTSFNSSDTLTESGVGYLVVKCDSSGSDIYVDDMYLGQSPINSPIPLSPGKHTVTYLHPEYLTLLRTYDKENEIQDLMASGFKTIYIIPRQTVTVNLWWKPYKERLEARRRRLWIRSGIGLGLVTAILTLTVLALD